MWVSHIALTDFRSYGKASLELPSGPSVLVGPNGQGKTNLVEAIGYVATLSSHRVSSDAALIRQGREAALIQVAAKVDSRPISVEVTLNRTGANQARVNKNRVPRIREALGNIRCVVFAPEDLRLVRGDPSERRRFLDELMVQVAPRYAGLRLDYERVLKQRNALLRSSAGRGSDAISASLAAWDEQLIAAGTELMLGRLNALRWLAPALKTAYQQISPIPAELTAEYRSSTGETQDLRNSEDVAAALRVALLAQRSAELARGVTLVGPHRDDLEISLDGTLAKGFASHGESWSICLALRMASFSVITEITQDHPILVLDDVFAELDSQRRERLAHSVSSADQVLITAAVAADIPTGLGGQRFEVAKSAGETHISAGK
ncbi:MAG: DNA replication/repair protein RecF [Actinomycetia bacterium]|nr:DNA replication/repair protein RecF [Actinomycetes bacterium]